MLELWLKVILKSENYSTLVHTLRRTLYMSVGKSPIFGAFLNEGLLHCLPVVGNFSLLWKTSNSNSWKNTQIHHVGDLHMNGTRKPTLYLVLQKMWIPFMKIKPCFCWLLCNPCQKQMVYQLLAMILTNYLGKTM